MLFSSTSAPVSKAVADGHARATIADMAARAEQLQKEYEPRALLARKVNTVLDSKFKPLVLELLAKGFDPDVFTAMALQSGISIYNNVMVDCIDKAATAWSEGAEFTLAKGGVSVDNASFTTMMSRAKYNQHMNKIDALCMVHPAVAVGPEVTWSPRIGKRALTHTILTPDCFDLIPCEENSADWCAIVIYTTDCGKRFRTIWTVDEYAVYEARQANGITGPVEWVMVGGVEANPWGVIPYTIFQRPSERLWSNHKGEELLDATLIACAAETLLRYKMPKQCKALIGMFKDAPALQILTDAAMLNAGSGTAALVDFTTDVKTFREVFVTAVRRQCLLLLGLKGDEFDTTSQPASGEALKLLNYARDEQARKRRPWLRDGLTAWYWLDLHILYKALPMSDVTDGGVQVLPVDGFDGGWVFGKEWTPPAPESVLPPSEAGVPPERQAVQFRVDVQEPVYPQLATERQADQEYRLKKNLTNLAKILMEENPDIASEDDALEELQHNADVNAKASVIPSTEGSDSASAPMDGKLLTSALEVVTLVASGKISDVSAIELLVAIGIQRDLVEKMVQAEMARPVPEAPTLTLTPQAELAAQFAKQPPAGPPVQPPPGANP